MTLDVVLTVLTILSYGLAITGACRAARALLARYRTLAAPWRWLDAETERRGGDRQAAMTAMSLAFPSRSTVHDVAHLRELVAYIAVSERIPGWQIDLAMVGAGLACGFLADILSVWLVRP